LEKRKYRDHTKWNGKEFVPKKPFDNENDAVNAARYLNSQIYTIHKMVAYKCRECGKWHIGKNNTELTEDDRQHYKDMLSRNKKFGI
jgi:hypothetical protein